MNASAVRNVIAEFFIIAPSFCFLVATPGRPDKPTPWLDATDADTNERSDLEQLETDGAAGGLRELAIMQADPAQGAE
jgi:hypothetical protein